MIDRAARNYIVEAIDAFTSGKITSRTFDARLLDDAPKTRDRTVPIVAAELWVFYDDFIDHPARLSKPQWDYVQRLRLVLMSDAELCNSGKWRARQPAAFAALVVLGAVAWFHGVDWNFWLVDMFIGGIAVSAMHLPTLDRSYTLRHRVIPFESFGEILALRRRVPEFRKQPYPRERPEKPLRGPIWSAVMTLTGMAALSVMAPVTLLICMLPPLSEIRVKRPVTFSSASGV